ncbi:alpha/beta fold hydrolase [Aspergillus ruber CBS 135680]|uniref:Alpha/beta-hydrolase n=1 Tax=Aspergillus ruber (strain CBS 135680) TaxID=1388766 RepID=A0A017SPA9_ASPRC|nr:alpha/beta-hydrolase [Aspergillus ruber CBS 135680]EYE98065.1 alpha/beta-hydrolase [Aspergillus ruber CBS 135680]
MPFVEVNTHKIHYADSHPDGAPSNGLTFIFIHGLGSSQNFYYPVIPYLTPKHRCITLDTYGAARSEYTGQPISIASIAQDVVSVLSKFQVPQAVVVGHSMGGLVVTLLGANYADRVKGIIAIGPTHPSETLVNVMTKRAETVSQSGMEPMANTIPFGATGTGASALSKSFIRELILNQTPKGYAALCNAIASAPSIDYSAINKPFLLIAGEEDKSASLDGCHFIFDNVQGKEKRMEVLAGVGHWHCVEAPDQVGRAVLDFVENGL